MTALSRKPRVTDRAILRSSSRLRSRVLALLEGALEVSGMSQVEVADRLGIKKAAVSNTLNGSGNITIDTLALYLGAMGYEADLIAAGEGEILASMREGRSPRAEILTLRDRDWENSSSVLAVGTKPMTSTRRVGTSQFESLTWGSPTNG